MKQIVVVGESVFTMGFSLAGIAKVFPLSKDHPDSTIRELISNQNIGLIIIQEESINKLSGEMREIVAQSIEPVFLTITEDESNEEMRKLIKKSIGVDLWNK